MSTPGTLQFVKIFRFPIPQILEPLNPDFAVNPKVPEPSDLGAAKASDCEVQNDFALSHAAGPAHCAFGVAAA
jgi:hypothetical protein